MKYKIWQVAEYNVGFKNTIKLKEKIDASDYMYVAPTGEIVWKSQTGDNSFQFLVMEPEYFDIEILE